MNSTALDFPVPRSPKPEISRVGIQRHLDRGDRPQLLQGGMPPFQL